MDPISLIAALTTVIPLATAALKKVFGTHKIASEDTRKSVHVLLPLFLGMASAGLHAYATGGDLLLAIAAGLGAGGVASSVRDVDANLIGLAQSIVLIVTKKGGNDAPKSP